MVHDSNLVNQRTMMVFSNESRGSTGPGGPLFTTAAGGWCRTMLLLAAGLAAALPTGRLERAGAQETSSSEAADAYARAASAQKNNAYDLAAEQWTAFLRKYPQDSLAPRAHYYLGVCRLQLKQYAPAAEAFGKLLEAAPEHELAEDARLNQGWCLYTLGRDQGDADQLQQAAARFDELRKKHPQGKYSDQALFFGAESRYAAGDVDGAVPLYRQLLKEHAESRLAVDGAYALGVALEESRQYDAARLVYDNFLKQHADHALAAEVRMRRAESDLQLGKAEQAAGEFAQLAETAGFELADYALMRHAACLAQLDRQAEAAARYAELPEKFPRSQYLKEAVLAAGRGFYRAGDDERAAKWLSRAWETDKDLDAAHWLVRSRLRAGQHEQAEEAASAALPLAEGDDHARLQMDLADTYYAAGRREESLELYGKAYQQHPEAPSAPQALYNAAFGAMELARHEQALQLAEQFAEKFAAHELAPDAQYVAAESLLQTGQYEAADQRFQKLLAEAGEHRDRALWTLRRGWSLFLPGGHDATIAFLEKAADALSSAAQQAEAWFLVGSSRFAKGDYAQAAVDLRRSLDLDAAWPRADETLLLLSRSLQRENKLAEALAAAQRVVSDFADSNVLDQAWYRQGEYQYALGAFEAAVDAYDRVLQTKNDSPFAPFALHGKAWSLIKAEKYADAVAALEQFEQQHGDHELAAESLFARVIANRQNGGYEAALADVEAFLKTQPTPARQADAAYEQGLAQAALKQFEQAAQTFEELLRKQPEYAGADKVLYEWAWALKSQDQNEQAAAKFAELTEKFGESPFAAEAWYHVGQQQYEQQEYAAAATSYQKSLDASQQAGLREKSLYKLGWARFELGQFAEAKSAFAEQAGLGEALPLYPDACFMEAECLFRAGQYAEACEQFKRLRAEKIQPPAEAAQALLLLHGAQAAAQVKDWETSSQWLRDMISQHPESTYLPEAKVELGWALQNQDRGEEALQLYADSGARGVLAARADFLSGEVHFAAKRFDEAVKSFRKVMFLYDAATFAGVEPWQAQAGFEAGRCTEVRIKDAPNEDQRQQLIEAARSFYGYVLEKHGETQFAKSAQARLKALEQL